MQILGSSQHHQLVGGLGGGIAEVPFVGEGEIGWVEVPAIVGGCLGLRSGKSQVFESLPHICDRGLFVLPDIA